LKAERANGEPRLRLTVQYACPREGLPGRAELRRWVRAALAQPAEITLRFVDENEGRNLNREYRGKDCATNVLSFPYGDDFRPEQTGLAGDVALCAPVLLREAHEARKRPASHCAHLIVHGVLHLQGYDHESDADARVMETLESFILMRLGFENPYL
jgi:probable rRNA maturation factor